MTTLVFHTPSRNCPFRDFNGEPVTIVHHLGHKRTRRSGLVQYYQVQFAPGLRGWAFGDELFIEPRTENQ